MAKTEAPRAVYDKQRGTAYARGYDRQWEKVRLAHLKGEPLCRFCLERGEIKAAAVVDHIRTIAERPDLRLDDANLRSLCKPCHDAHTARQVAAGHRNPQWRAHPHRGVGFEIKGVC